MPGFAINQTDSSTSIDHQAEFHRAHRWQIENLGIPFSINASSVFRPRLYAKTLELPSLSFEEEKVDGASLKYKFPKRANWDNITVSFYDVQGIHNRFHLWQQSIWTPEEGLKPAADFKGTAVFLLTDGSGEEMQRYTLVGCYPTKVSHSELSAASSEVKLLNVTYAFDYATIIIKDLAPRSSDQQTASTVRARGAALRIATARGAALSFAASAPGVSVAPSLPPPTPQQTAQQTALNLAARQASLRIATAAPGVSVTPIGL